MSADYVSDWPPMRKAMARATYRKLAVGGLPEDLQGASPADRLIRAQAEDSLEYLRQLLSGTDVPAEEVLRLMARGVATIQGMLAEDVPLEEALAGMIADVFLVGFVTSEEMPRETPA